MSEFSKVSDDLVMKAKIARRFREGKETLLNSCKFTDIEGLEFKLVDTTILESCTNLIFTTPDEKNETLKLFQWNDVNNLTYNLIINGNVLSYDISKIYLDEKPMDKSFQLWNDYVLCDFVDKELSIKISYYQVKNIDKNHKLNFIENDIFVSEGGKVVMDLCLCNKYDDSKVIHRFVYQNYHNGLNPMEILFISKDYNKTFIC